MFQRQRWTWSPEQLVLQIRPTVCARSTTSYNSLTFRVALKLKYDTACELREMVDSVRDVEAARIFPHMLSVLLDTLRNTEPSFRRASLEFQFRRVLVEIIHRIPPSEAFRPHVSNMLATIIYILRHDSEDNAATCLKTLHDVVRAVKGLPEEPITELLLIFLQMLRTMPSLVVEFFSEDSNQVDSSVVFPAARSFKVLTEIPFIVVIFVQNYRHLTQPLLSDILNATLDVSLRIFHFEIVIDIS